MMFISSNFRMDMPSKLLVALADLFIMKKLKTPCNWYTRGGDKQEAAEKKQSLENQLEELMQLVVENVKEEMTNIVKEKELFSSLHTLSRKVDDTLRSKELAAKVHTEAVKNQEAAYALFNAAVGLNNQEISAMEASTKLAAIAAIYKAMLEASVTVAKTMKRKKQANDNHVAAVAAFHYKESEYNTKLIEWHDKKVDHHKTFLAFIQKKQEMCQLGLNGESSIDKENVGGF